MNPLTSGIISGLIFGLVVVGMMVPMSFPDKKAALSAAFINRFSIGLIVGAIQLPLPGWLGGAAIGLLLSLPDALITKAYAPILTIGPVGGAIIGLIVSKYR
ncbi:MAG: hypothetical protein ACHQ2Z_04910 [Elusimicrobiota bacterium]